MSNTTYNLSELIKTDCYIDCGTNKQLREVVNKLEPTWRILNSDKYIRCDTSGRVITTSFSTFSVIPTIPLTSINIDL